ncbi:MAG: glutathione binding-like protein [Hyphomonadaceae bacterium]|nr:glutathione binding-like protein [Hyphomonadaceae bacterium]
MKLFFSPGSCSLAPHILIHEGGLPVEAERVLMRETPRKTESGRLYAEINAMGAVPALELDNGEVLTENAVLLQYLCELKPEAKLAPTRGGMEHWRFLEMLNFISTELHKTFSQLFAGPPPEWKEKVLERLFGRLDLLQSRLGEKEYLLGGFSAADAYAFAVLGWSAFFQIDLGRWPKLQAYYERVKARPAVQRAMEKEGLIAKA